MSEGTGSKVKKIGRTLLALGIVASLIMGFYYLIASSEAYGVTKTACIISGLVWLVAGIAGSAIGGYLICAFGELIETNCEILRLLRNNSNTGNAVQAEDKQTGNAPAVSADERANNATSIKYVAPLEANGPVRCPECGEESSEMYEITLTNEYGINTKKVLCGKCYRKLL